MDRSLSHGSPGRVRARIRAGLSDVTTGMCLGHMQANLVILPAGAAAEFAELCTANPGPMPLVDVCRPGDPVPRRVAPGADLRTDLPRYLVYRNGRVARESTDIVDLWRDDLVAFLLGCSFSAEASLLGAGIRLRHCEL